ncbi:D-lactate dehydrogenase [Halotalea alkalilenta]|uniref:D-lactate dehydrogenase n=1 Tax=Halotalea alkalilenta TaxID=376489 RepID=UPI00069478C9|nr:D-lactate dehydrogenase [Halotalea alkalilenta]
MSEQRATLSTSPFTTSPSDARQRLIERLEAIVGPRETLTDERSTRRYRKGFRFGEGRALAVVRPGSLVEQWRVVKACVEADVIVIMQAANTGLTGGSTPDGNDYDRDIVIISTLRMDRLHLIRDGRQVICFPGATLYGLERALRPLGREPHSVIGSSCIGASVFGGVSNNSGGALVQRGPAYTELALYAQLNADGQLELVNHLGIRLGDEPEEILARLERGDFKDEDISSDAGAASDPEYRDHVREIDAETPARFNADPRRLHEASGCAGKLALFAVRLDTFPAAKGAKVFYIGTNSTAELTELRRALLAPGRELPIAGEYLHRDAFDIAEAYGKDTFLMIQRFGTDRMPAIFAFKGAVDAFFERLKIFPDQITDRLGQWLSRLFPSHLPARMKEYRDRFEHHLMLKVPAEEVASTRVLLGELFPGTSGAFFECTEEEGSKAFLHRFAAAGAAIRYRTMHAREVEDIVALDIALKRNERDWFETLPAEIESKLVKKLYYGHFLCHVFHQDYVVAKGTDCLALEHQMWALLDQRGAEYPAEHNVGHLYRAKPALREFYQKLDPCNCFNPGIGQTPKAKHWGHAPARAAASDEPVNG